VEGSGAFGTGKGVGNFGWDWAHAAVARRLVVAIAASRTQPDRFKPGRRIIPSVVTR
jgi:hypothetical protein